MLPPKPNLDKETLAKIEAGKKFKEFVLKVDRGCGSPILRAGFIIIGDKETNFQNYIVVASEGGMFSLKDMELVRKSIGHPNTKIPKRAHISFIESCVPVDAIINGEDRNLIAGLVVYGLFTLTSVGGATFNKKTEPCHLAASTHIYVNNLPAGLNSGTDILMVGLNTPPHQAGSQNQFTFVDIDGENIIVRPVGTTNTLSVDPSLFSFYDHHMHERSSQASLLARLITSYQLMLQKVTKKKGKN